MASSLQRLGSNSGKAYRSVFTPLSRAFSTADSLVENPRRKVLNTQQGSGDIGTWKINFMSTQNTVSTATETRSQKLERIAHELLDLNKIESHDYVILLRHKMGISVDVDS